MCDRYFCGLGPSPGLWNRRDWLQLCLAFKAQAALADILANCEPSSMLREKNVMPAL